LANLENSCANTEQVKTIRSVEIFAPTQLLSQSLLVFVAVLESTTKGNENGKRILLHDILTLPSAAIENHAVVLS